MDNKCIIYLKSGQCIEDAVYEDTIDDLMGEMQRSDIVQGFESTWVRGIDISAIRWLD